MTHDYRPWTGELKVHPMRCPICAGPTSVWQYVELPGAPVLRVVMCDAPELDAINLPMVLDHCLMHMPHDSFYCQTAARAVKVWNQYGAALVARRSAAT